MKKKGKILFALLTTISLLAVSCARGQPAEIGAEPTQPPQQAEQPTAEMQEPMGLDRPIVVGSKEFTEQLLLGSMITQLLQANGYEVTDQTGLGGTTVNREALQAGEIDVYWEYTGTALVNFLGVEDVITDPQQAYDMSREADAANALAWLTPAELNNTYTVMVRNETVQQGIASLSDLAAAVNASPGDWRLCTNAEFYARPDGFKGVEELYGFQFLEDNVVAMDTGLTYQALTDGQCETAMGFATDGRIAAFNFTNLDDDKGFFPTYNPAPVIRQEVLDADPKVGDLLSEIGPKLDTATMTTLNKRVDIDEESVDAVAHDFLVQAGLLEPTVSYDQPIVVGSKEFTEQLLLGSMSAQLLQANGYEVTDQTGLGGTTVNREALEADEIDVYWEYTGTALVNFLGVEDVITDPQQAYDMSREADAANALAWLTPAEFNNTYTVMVRNETVQEGIASLSDLATAVKTSPGDWRLCTNAEFYARPDGFKGVEELYGFQFLEDNVVAMDTGLTYQALTDGQCETAMGFATDGRIAAFNFTNLDDDKGFFPTYNPAPVIRQEVLDADPNVGTVLSRLGPTLDTATMTTLNKRVDIDEESVDAVACDHLLSNGLVGSCP